MSLFELKIEEPKDGRYIVVCLEKYEPTMYGTLDEAIERAKKYLNDFQKSIKELTP